MLTLVNVNRTTMQQSGPTRPKSLPLNTHTELSQPRLCEPNSSAYPLSPHHVQNRSSSSSLQRNDAGDPSVRSNLSDAATESFQGHRAPRHGGIAASCQSHRDYGKDSMSWSACGQDMSCTHSSPHHSLLPPDDPFTNLTPSGLQPLSTLPIYTPQSHADMLQAPFWTSASRFSSRSPPHVPHSQRPACYELVAHDQHWPHLPKIHCFQDTDPPLGRRSNVELFSDEGVLSDSSSASSNTTFSATDLGLSSFDFDFDFDFDLSMRPETATVLWNGESGDIDGIPSHTQSIAQPSFPAFDGASISPFPEFGCGCLGHSEDGVLEHVALPPQMHLQQGQVGSSDHRMSGQHEPPIVDDFPHHRRHQHWQNLNPPVRCQEPLSQDRPELLTKPPHKQQKDRRMRSPRQRRKGHTQGPQQILPALHTPACGFIPQVPSPQKAKTKPVRLVRPQQQEVQVQEKVHVPQEEQQHPKEIQAMLPSVSPSPLAPSCAPSAYSEANEEEKVIAYVSMLGDKEWEAEKNLILMEAETMMQGSVNDNGRRHKLHRLGSQKHCKKQKKQHRKLVGGSKAEFKQLIVSRFGQAFEDVAMKQRRQCQVRNGQRRKRLLEVSAFFNPMEVVPSRRTRTMLLRFSQSFVWRFMMIVADGFLLFFSFMCV
eukprot:m.212087 g.212087  ORF g.212087 m.212087 type:complete len:653 (+) comp15070_c0_seq2:445-2403(+)